MRGPHIISWGIEMGGMGPATASLRASCSCGSYFYSSPWPTCQQRHTTSKLTDSDFGPAFNDALMASCLLASLGDRSRHWSLIHFRAVLFQCFAIVVCINYISAATLYIISQWRWYGTWKCVSLLIENLESMKRSMRPGVEFSSPDSFRYIQFVNAIHCFSNRILKLLSWFQCGTQLPSLWSATINCWSTIVGNSN